MERQKTQKTRFLNKENVSPIKGILVLAVKLLLLLLWLLLLLLSHCFQTQSKQVTFLLSSILVCRQRWRLGLKRSNAISNQQCSTLAFESLASNKYTKNSWPLLLPSVSVMLLKIQKGIHFLSRQNCIKGMYFWPKSLCA